MTYLIFRCLRCRRPLIAREFQKARVCPFCGARNTLERLKPVARAASAREARQVAVALKLEESG